MRAMLLSLLPLLVACPTDKPTETGDTGVEDVLAQLSELEGVVEAWEAEASTPDTRFYVLAFEQPLDHADPDGPTFRQWVSVLHRDADAPVVLNTRGYYNNWSGSDNELSWVLGGNRINVEHRFFADSAPDEPDWSLLRVQQQSDDLHAITSALKPIYTGRWISTGASKDGMTALFYRAHYPTDVDGTVAYVAPLLQGYPDDADGAFSTFFDSQGSAECRAKLLALQRGLLGHAEELTVDLIVQGSTLEQTFDVGGADYAFQTSVAELPWSFWQYDGDCEALPADPEDMSVVWPWFLDWVGSPYWYSDQTLAYYGPYFYQSAAELGYPTVPYDDIDDLLTVDPDDVAGLLPTDEIPTYDGSVVRAAEDWVVSEGSEILLIYGEQDPWTVRGITPDGAVDSFRLDAPGANHGANLAMLSAEDQAIAWDAVSRWSGVEVDTSAARRTPPPEPELLGRAARHWETR